MRLRQYFLSYSLARRATFAAVAAFVSMLLVAGLTLAALFEKDQIEKRRVAALTQASVASSTASAAQRFGGSEMIVESYYVCDRGPTLIPPRFIAGKVAYSVNSSPMAN